MGDINNSNDNAGANSRRSSHDNSAVNASQSTSSRLYTQLEVDQLLDRHEKEIAEDFESIIANLRSQLNSLSVTLVEEEAEQSKQIDAAVEYVKEAHLCPFNCFKESEIKERTRLTSLPVIASQSGCGLSSSGSGAPASQINYVSDKHFKTSLILQKRLENAEKELVKAKSKQQNSGASTDSITTHQTFAAELSRILAVCMRFFSGINCEFRIPGLNTTAESATANNNDANPSIGIDAQFEAFVSKLEEELLKRQQDRETLESRLNELEASVEEAKRAEEEMNDLLIEKVAQAEIALNDSKQEQIRLMDALTIKMKKESDLSPLFKLLDMLDSKAALPSTASFTEQLELIMNRITAIGKESNPCRASIAVSEDHSWKEQIPQEIELIQALELEDFNLLKKQVAKLYMKMKEDKEYAEKTAIDTKLVLAETQMSRDYYEHNFVKLLKRVK